MPQPLVGRRHRDPVGHRRDHRPGVTRGLQPRRGGVGAVRAARSPSYGRPRGREVQARGAAGASSTGCRSCPRGAGTGLSGGANAIDGLRWIISFERMNAILRDRPGRAARGRAARRGQRRPARGRRRARTLVPAGPGQLAVVDHRRQRRHQRRRGLLREVRRHPRLRPRAARSSPAPASWSGSAARPPRASPATTWPAAGRLGGHPRDGHRDHRPAASRPAASTRWSASSTPWSPPARRWRRWPAPASSRRRWSCWTGTA